MGKLKPCLIYKPYSDSHLSIHFHLYTLGLSTIFFTCTGRKKDLEKSLNQFNTKQPSIKFEYEISRERISILNTEIYIKKNKLHTKIFGKKTDHQKILQHQLRASQIFEKEDPM